jgi:hypothetical protein
MHTLERCSICGGVLQPWPSMPIDPKKEKPTPFGDRVRFSHCSYGSTDFTVAADWSDRRDWFFGQYY